MAGQPEILAQHFIEGGLPDRGATYLLAAGRLAKARNAIREAISQLETCLRLITLSPHAADPTIARIERECRLMLGDLISLFDDIKTANTHYERSAALAETDAEGSDARNRMHRLRYAERDLARIAFYEHGNGKPTILMVNPIIHGLATFQPILEQLCQEFRVITVDCRGAGRSDDLVRPYSILQHMEDVRAAIETAEAAPIVAVGISRGSTLLLHLAHEHPELVGKLMIVGANVVGPVPGGGQSRNPEFQRRRDEALGRGALDEVAQVLAEAAYSELDSDDLRRIFAEHYRQVPKETLLAFLDHDPAWDIEPLLELISLPVLVAHGREDRMVNWAVSEFIASRIPNAQLYFFEGRGHNPMFSATDEFCHVLRNFVRTGRAESQPEVIAAE